MEKKTKSARVYKNNGLTMSAGNGKLNDTIAIFNLPAGKTCPNCSQCIKTCYAIRSEKRYPHVKACRQSNAIETTKGTFIENMIELIKKTGKKYVRVHESGDFYSQDYADKWSAIAARMKDIQFFAYTKSPYRPKAANFNIVESILPDNSINFGTMKYIEQKAKEFNAFICPCGIEQSEEKICGNTCFACTERKHVVFLSH